MSFFLLFDNNLSKSTGPAPSNVYGLLFDKNYNLIILAAI